MKIAVFRGLYLGDLVAATGALRTLRRGYPGAEIALVSLPWATALAPHLTCVDRLLPYPGAPGLDGEGSKEELEDFLGRVRAERFDLAVNLHGRGPASTRLVLELGARQTAGFANPDAPSLDFEVPWEATPHESRKLLLLAEKVTAIATGDATPELHVRPEDGWRARKLISSNSRLSSDRPEVTRRAAGTPDSRLPTPDSPERAKRSDLALIHPGASVPEKRWPGEAFGTVARDLLRRGYTVAVTGSPGEKELTRRVTELAPGSIDLGGRTDLSTLIALAARADVVVTNDTGPAHLAYASGTPSVTLFGPSTDVERWGPLDRNRHAVLRGNPISEIPARTVVERVEELVLGREEERSA